MPEPWQIIGDGVQGGTPPSSVMRGWLQYAMHVGSFIFRILMQVLMVPVASSVRGRLFVFLRCCLIQLLWHVWLECGCYIRRRRPDATMNNALAELKREQAELRVTVASWDAEPVGWEAGDLPALPSPSACVATAAPDLLSGCRDFVGGRDGERAYTRTAAAQGLAPPLPPPVTVPETPSGGVFLSGGPSCSPLAQPSSYVPLEGESAESTCCSP